MRDRTINSGQCQELAVTLLDLAWLLPRTIGEADHQYSSLPLSELEVMRLLVRRPGISVTQAASELRLLPSNTSAAVRSLVARGLVERRRDSRDARVTRLHPTPEATAHRRRQEVAWGDELHGYLERLDPADRAHLLAAVPVLGELAGVLRELGNGLGPDAD